MLLMLLTAAAALKPFDYKGYIAGAPIDGRRIEHCQEDSPEACTLKLDDELIDGYRPLLSVATSYKGRLSTVSISANSLAFLKITDAFKAKYGAPCARTMPMWRSRVGAPVPNPTYTWCFASGKLTAVMHGVLIDVSEFEYRDRNIEPARKPHPKIDF